MKRKLLVFAFALVSGIASAQFTIWEDDFEDKEISDWTVVDQDGDGLNWISRTNIQIDNNNTVADGTYNILGTYNIGIPDGLPLSVVQQNWAISPEIDLSYYGGTMQLILNAQKAIFDASGDLYIYVSTTDTNPSSFTKVGTIEIVRNDMFATEFADYTVDISQFAGQSKVYFALVNPADLNVGIEVDKVSITAATLGLDDIDAKKKTVLKQNPVQNYLDLQLNDNLIAEEVNLKVYNTSGILVKESKYSDSEVSVNNLSAGVYFLVIEDGTVTEKIKFIKK